MSGRHYRIPIGAESVYEQLRTWIDQLLGLPNGQATTWFPPAASAVKDANYFYIHILEEHYQNPSFKPWFDQAIATTWVQQVNAADWFAAVALIDAPPPAPVPDAWTLGREYRVGDLCTYSGVTYRCKIAHTPYDAGHPPPVVPAIWDVAT